MKISQKQSQLIKSIIQKNLPEISVLGSEQSGKTFCVCLGLIYYAAALYKYDPKGSYYGAIIGWDLGTLKGNIIVPLESFLKTPNILDGFISDKNQKGTILLKEGNDFEIKWSLDTKYVRIFNTIFYCFGFNTNVSFNKIQGRPLIFEWVDESAKIYSQSNLQESFDKLPGRMASFSGHPYKKTIHTFNVEGNSHHPYKIKYLDNSNAVKFVFYPYDNPKIDTRQKYLEFINTYPEGALREQKIFNRWVVSEGKVFNKINIIHNLDNLLIIEIGIGCDYGNVNPTTFVPFALCLNQVDRRWVIVRLPIYYHISGENGEKPTTAWYVEQFKKFLKYLQKTYPNIPITCNVVDSEAIHYTNALYNAGVDYTLAKKGSGSVDNGVQQLQSLFYKDVLYILEGNSIDKIENDIIYHQQDEGLIEMESYQYDTMKSLNTGVNCYKKEQDHSIDATRYLISYWQDIGKCLIV